MDRHVLSASKIVEFGDDNVRHVDHGHMALTSAVFCRDRDGEWFYAGMFHSLTLPPDGVVHFTPAGQ